MSAVRMVAYGVLELNLSEETPRALFLEADAAEIARSKQAAYERDQLRKLVNDELRRYGLLLSRRVKPKGHGWRTSGDNVLYGQVIGRGSFPVREILAEGDFKECCIKAAELLDALDKSQVPDAATGND